MLGAIRSWAANRNGLVVGGLASRATGHSKCLAGEVMVMRNTSGRRSNIGEEMTASEGYHASQIHRKRIEEVFGWVKTVARFSKTRHRGLARVDWHFTLARRLRPTTTT